MTPDGAIRLDESITIEATIPIDDQNVYRRWVDGQPGPGNTLQATCTTRFPALDPAKAKRVVLWGGRKDDIQAGSFEDWEQTQRLNGEIVVHFPKVTYGVGWPD